MVSKMPPGVGGEYSGVTSRISAIASVARARRGGGAGEQESSICNLQQKQVREGMTECMHFVWSPTLTCTGLASALAAPSHFTPPRSRNMRA